MFPEQQTLQTDHFIFCSMLRFTLLEVLLVPGQLPLTLIRCLTLFLENDASFNKTASSFRHSYGPYNGAVQCKPSNITLLDIFFGRLECALASPLLMFA
jgi:hypothetical protein